jgi:transcriptional regulator with XRE-family HTH domain
MGENNEISLRIGKLINESFSGNNSKFSRMVGISEANIRNYLKGTQPKADSLAKMSKVLDVSCEWLLLGKGEMFNSKKSSTELKEMSAKQEIKEPKDLTIFNQSKAIVLLLNKIEELEQNKKAKSVKEDNAEDAASATKQKPST